MAMIDPKILEEISMYQVWVNGIAKPLWATETQANLIISYANNPELRQNLLKLGKTVFKVSSVVRMEEIVAQRYRIPTYATKRYDEELNKVKII